MPRNLSRRIVVSLALAAGLHALCSCAAGPDRAAISFPVGDRRAGVLDIQVLRHGTRITMTNTTSQGLGPGRLWLNEWYSRSVERFDPGQTMTLPLSGFYDEAGVRIEAGGFFATKAPTPIVAAHFEEGDALYGLVVVTSKDE